MDEHTPLVHRTRLLTKIGKMLNRYEEGWVSSEEAARAIMLAWENEYPDVAQEMLKYGAINH